MENLISANWLLEHLDDPNLVILDCTNFSNYDAESGRYITVSGQPCWNAEHIPSSRFASFTTGLCGEGCQYRNTLPDPQKMIETMERLGVYDDARVVLYDSISSMWAARVWWMLRWIGFDNAAVLDAGLQGWKAAGGDTIAKTSRHHQAKLSTCLRSDLFVTKETVIKALDEETSVLVDALSREQFSGSKSELGLCGHIPGAINVPAESLLDPITGRYLPKEQLVELLPANRDARTIVYCGSGIAAASVAFSMLLTGFTNVAIYMPGFQEWMQDSSLLQSI